MVAPDSLEATIAALRDAAVDGSRRCIVVGGDGLIHHAVNEFAETNRPLGIIPAGTGNDFAGALGLPHETSAAVEAALEPGAATDLLRLEPSGRQGAWERRPFARSVCRRPRSGPRARS